MNLLFLGKEQARKKYLRTIQRYSRYSEIISFDRQTKDFLDSFGIKNAQIYDYVDFDSNRISTQWLNDWIDQNKELMQEFEYDGLPIWWLIECWIYDTIGYRNSVQEVITALALIKSVIKKERPEKILFFDSKDLNSKIIKLFPNNEKIGDSTNYSRNIKSFIRLKLLKLFFTIRYPARRLAWQALKLIYGKERPSFDENKKKVLFFTTSAVDNFFDPIDKKIKSGNPYTSPIISYLDLSKNTDYILPDLYSYKNPISFNIMKNGIKEVKYSIIEDGKVELKKVNRAYKNLKDLWKKKAQDERFKDSFKYEGMPVWELLKPQFFCYFNIRLKDHLIYYEVMKKNIETYKPHLAIYPSETGDLLRMCAYICEKNNIKSLGLQHGTVDYTPLTVHKFKKSKKFKCPIPTITSVYGDFYKRFLIDTAGYPKGSVATCGNPRYDVYEHLPKTLDDSTLINEIGFNANKKIMFFLTPPPLAKDDRHELGSLVFDFAKRNDYQLIVKMHPGERSDSIYRELEKQSKVKDLRIFSGYNSLKLIKISDVVVGPESTLDYEAMILGKPVVIINLSGQADEMEFVREGAALSVTKKEDFDKTLNQLEKTDIKKVLKVKMRRFVYDQCYKIDGKSSERIAKVIKNLLK